MVFDKPPAKGVERLKMAYRRVRISDAPDDVSSRELGRLDRGDEVELVDSYEGFLQVRTPGRRRSAGSRATRSPRPALRRRRRRVSGSATRCA